MDDSRKLKESIIVFDITEWVNRKGRPLHITIDDIMD